MYQTFVNLPGVAACAVLATSALGVSGQALAAPVLSPLWSDDAVIQRDQPIIVEGSATPGEAVTVLLGKDSLTATAGSNGKFSVSFAARPASALPLELEVRGADGNPVRYKGLVIGDVWLCSGQSNMEMTVERALDAWNQAQSANDPLLRMATIAKAVHHQPKAEFDKPVMWQTTRPGSVSAFSAACYYMAKELRKRLDVPVGTINASWGGSASRPWLTPEGGRAIFGDDEMALLHRFATNPALAAAQFSPRWEEWYRGQSGGSEPWAKPDSTVWLDVPKMGPWNEWHGTPLADNPVGTVWLRKTVTLTAAQAKGQAQMTLGAIDDMDMTWVNGKAVGNSHGWDEARNYALPSGYLKAGTNEIIIAATNSWGGGGLVQGGDLMGLSLNNGENVALSTGWRYAISPVKNYPPRAPWDRQAGIGVMHNAMVAPLGHYAAAGVAWYQGESDVGTPGYATRMKALMAGWRSQFGGSARMLVVQLADFGPPQLRPQESGWADLREEQRKAVLADANAALVTAVDLGERLDIHPANKNELGRRLAMAATGEALPQPLSATREASGVRVRFSGVQGRLTTWSGATALGFELCGSAPESCRYASAIPDGDGVLLSSDGQPVSRVRYGWADSPVLNLYDERPLPPPGFELTVTP